MALSQDIPRVNPLHLHEKFSEKKTEGGSP